MGNLKLKLGPRSSAAPVPPADGDFFSDFAAGNDGAAGTEASPFKHIPGDPGAGASVAAMVLAPGDITSLKRGERHRPATYTARNEYPGDTNTQHVFLKANGTSGSQIAYDAYGVGEPPIISGDIPVTGWAAATEVEVGGNPEWATIEVASVSGLLDLCQPLYEGDDFMVPAQWPTPNDPYSFNRVTPGISGYLTMPTADFAAKVTTGANDSGGAGYKRVEVISDLGTGNFKDHYDADSAPVAGASRVVCYMTGARYTESELLDYDVATGTIAFKILNSQAVHTSGASSGLMRYAVRYNPADIRKVGQFGWGPDVAGVRKAYGKFRGSGERSVARIAYGTRLGKDYTSFKNLEFGRFAHAAGQVILQNDLDNPHTNLVLENVKFKQCMNMNGNWMLYLNEAGGAHDITITNLEVEDCIYTGGIAMINCTNIVIDGYKQLAEGRTPVYWGGTSHDCVLRNFDVSDCNSAHGNGPSPYQDTYRITIENGYAMARPRPISTLGELGPDPTDRDLIIRNLVCTTRRPMPGAFGESETCWQGGTGERGTLVEGCIFGVAASTMHTSLGSPPSTGMIIRNCVFSSLAAAELPGMSFENCLFFRETGGGLNDVVAKGATDLGGVVYDTGGQWQGVITVAMQQALTRNPGGVGYTARNMGHGDYPWYIPAYGETFSLADCALTTTVIRAGKDIDDVFSSVIRTQPGSTLSIAASHDGAKFGLWRGQIYCAELLAPGTYTLPVVQTNAHADLIGATTLTTLISILVV